jgi:hypothetical protein
MDGNSFSTNSYKLRSGGPIPIAPGQFLAQTFGVDVQELTFWEATTTLPESEDFIGASLDGLYTSASFQRMPYLLSNGKEVFRGNTIGKIVFENEDQMPGS